MAEEDQADEREEDGPMEEEQPARTVRRQEWGGSDSSDSS